VTLAGPEAGDVLVVGYGNPLRTDDGVGPAVAERLAGDPRLAGATVLTGHQLTPELAFDASRASLLILVDAEDGLAPGELSVRRLAAPDGDEASGPPLTHHLDPAGLLALARELFGASPPLVMVGIGTASMELGEGLTPQVEAAVARAADAVVAVVEEHTRA